MQTAKTKCDFCQHSKGSGSTGVHCGYFGKAMQIPEHCAAQQLTHEGWEDAAERAKERGRMDQWNEYSLMAIATQKAVVNNAE